MAAEIAIAEARHVHTFWNRTASPKFQTEKFELPERGHWQGLMAHACFFSVCRMATFLLDLLPIMASHKAWSGMHNLNLHLSATYNIPPIALESSLSFRNAIKAFT
jgi:hypothetical protein